jgi:alkylation response protein AidB-like acyl-CoA dehydrogenase
LNRAEHDFHRNEVNCMEFRFSPADDKFRDDVRAMLDANPPKPEDEETGSGGFERVLAAGGWLTAAWPKEYGGLGLTQIEQLIFKEELMRAGGTFPGTGVNLVGPTLMVHGTEAQRQEHLPKIAGGLVNWCQGFSEPAAGSDLASLQTRAVRDGDEFVINGQKIWTSRAQWADWILLLTRTDPDAPKHRGITMFLVDMKSQGVTVRPIRQLTGHAGFNEVFFDDLRVPAGNIVGEMNRGWYAATTTLDFERSGIERNLIAEGDWDRIHAFVRATPGAWIDGSARARFAELKIEVEVGRWLARRVAWLQTMGRVPNYEASMSKGFNSEVGQRVSEFGVNAFGLAGQVTEGARAALGGRAAFRYLDARRLTVAQGTAEIQRNIIATRGLGLPR